MKNNINFDKIVKDTQLDCPFFVLSKGFFDCIDELYNFIFPISKGYSFFESYLKNIGINDSTLLKCLLKV